LRRESIYAEDCLLTETKASDLHLIKKPAFLKKESNQESDVDLETQNFKLAKVDSEFTSALQSKINLNCDSRTEFSEKLVFIQCLEELISSEKTLENLRHLLAELPNFSLESVFK